MTTTVTTLRTLTRDLIASLNADKDTIFSEGYTIDDVAHDYVDSIIPVYNWELAECLADNPTLAQVAEPSMLPENPSVWQIISTALYEELMDVADEWISTVTAYVED